MAQFKTNPQGMDLHSLAAQRNAAAVRRRFAGIISPQAPGRRNRQPKLERWWAVIVDVNTDGTVAIQQDGVTIVDGTTGTPVPVTCLASYTPTIGDTVIVDYLGTDPLVIGTV